MKVYVPSVFWDATVYKIMHKNSAQFSQYVNHTYSAKHLLSFKTISQKAFAAYSMYGTLTSSPHWNLLVLSFGCSVYDFMTVLLFDRRLKQFSLSRLQPNVDHHLLVHGPRHSSHHGPPQRPWHSPSEETLQPMFLTQKEGRD